MKSLENVRVGDNLILRDRQERRVVVVDRTTKTQIIIYVGKFRKKDGQCVVQHSGKWARFSISLPRKGEVDEVNAAQMHKYLVKQIVDTCQYNVLKEMSLEQLERIYKVLQSIQSEECDGCSNNCPKQVSECPHCGMQKCESCDMGDDVECPSCVT